MVAVMGVPHPHKGHPLSEETKRKIAESRIGKHVSEETKHKMSEAHKGNKCALGHRHTDDTKRRMSSSRAGMKRSEETRRRCSEAQKGKIVTEETRKKLSIANKGKSHPGKPMTEENKKKIAIANTGRIISEETRQKLSKASTGRPNKNKGKHLPPEWRLHISEANKGKNNGRWLGGKSFEPYCPAFTRKLKEEIRKSFNYRCLLCGKHEHQDNRKLRVHHCDYNKGQGCGQKWNLVPLCGPCHTKTNFNRWYWFNLLSNYWALKYMDGDDFGEFFKLCGLGMPMFSG